MFSTKNFIVDPCCANCRHADFYPISFFDFRFAEPKCSIHGVDVCPDGVCECFELMGRCSR